MLCNLIRFRAESRGIFQKQWRSNMSAVVFTFVALVIVSVSCDRGTNIGCFRKGNSYMHLNVRADSVDTCITNCVKLFYRYAALDRSSCSCTHILTAEAVVPSDCNWPCSDNAQQYCGGEGTESYYDTGLRTAGPVTSVNFPNTTENTISVAWTPPESNALLDHYIVRAEVLETFSTRQLINPEWTVSKDERQFDMLGLHPGTKYNITIHSVAEGRSVGDAAPGSISLEHWTDVGEPDQEPSQPKVFSADDTSQIIEVYPVVNNNGPVSKYQLVVIFVTYGLMQTFDESLLRSYNESQVEGTQYYIAAELQLSNNTRRIKIGDGRVYNGFYNAPLPEKSHIHVAVGVISSLNGVTKARYGQTTHEQHSHLGDDLFALDDESNSVMIAVLSVLCVVLAILLAASVAMFVYVRRHAQSSRKRLNESHELDTQNGAAGGGGHEMENSGFIGDELGVGDFKQQLQSLFDRIPSHQLVPRNTLSLDIDNILGTGRFGDVIHGNLVRANGQNPLGNSSQIHVISEDMEGPDQVLFLKELDQLLRIQSHPLFLSLLGICSTPDWMYIIFDDTGRTLKRRLIESRLPMDVDPRRMTKLSEEFVVRIMSNIGDAMQYLSKNLIVHKQVCSYNVWMTANDEPKLSIFGPTLYIETRKLVDLARYQAPEVLRYQHHTTKSDVWSFACLAWECCTVGGTLYSNVISADLMARIRNGSRPEQTPFIFNDLYQLLLNCWELDPNDRLEMDEVALSLRQMLQTSPKHVLSFDRHAGLTLPYYLPLLEIKNFDE